MTTAPIDTSTLGPIRETEHRALTQTRLAEMVKALRPGERVTIERLDNGRLRIAHAHRDQIDEAPALT